MGLYLVVWGKSKEQKCVMPPSPEKGQQQLPVTVPKIEGNDDNNNKTQLVIIGDKTTVDQAHKAGDHYQIKCTIC